MRKGIFQRISGDFEHFLGTKRAMPKAFFEEKNSTFGKGLVQLYSASRKGLIDRAAKKRHTCS